MKSKILLALAISTSTAALYAQSGNVGIGTTTPLTKLHVTSAGTGGAGVFTANTANMALRLENIGNGQSVIQHFKTKDAGGVTKEFLLGINPTANGNGVFYFGRTGSVNDFIMDLGTGNLAMSGLPEAAAKLIIGGSLKVVDGTQGAGKVLTSDANGLSSWQTPAAAAPQYYDWLKAGGAQPTAAADNTGDIYHAGGKVAIGATAASGKLTVSGSGASLTPMLTLTNTNVAGNPTLNIYPGYTSNVAGIVEGNQNGVVFDQDPGLSNAGAGQSLYDFHGQLRAVNTSTLSDRRLKENIYDMKQYGLKEVMQMQPRNYTMKRYQTKEIGFIAQELKQIVPELVMGKETENSLLSVDYSKVCLVLINAIKDQQAQIETLKAQNAKLNIAENQANSMQKSYAELAQQVKEMQQMMGIKEIKGGSKMAVK